MRFGQRRERVVSGAPFASALGLWMPVRSNRDRAIAGESTLPRCTPPRQHCDEYDRVELLDTVVRESRKLPSVTNTSLVLDNSDHRPQVMAAKSGRSSLVEAQRPCSLGAPCRQSFSTAAVVQVLDIRSVHAVALRLKGCATGVLNVFREQPGSLPDGEAQIGQRRPTSPRSGSCRSERSRSRG